MTAKHLGLKDFLRLAFSEPVLWLQGDPRANVTINWVSASVDEAQPGDLLLACPDSRITSLIEHAASQGSSAVLLVGPGKLPEEFPDSEMIVLASPELTLDVRQLQRLMLSLLINQRAALVDRGVRIHARLLQMAAEGEGLEALAKAMAEISGRGVLIQDKRGRILAEHPSSTLLTIWADVVAQMEGLDSLPEIFRDRRKAAAGLRLHTQSMPGGLQRQISPIVVGQMARGYLSLVGIDGELDDLDHIVGEQGSFVCAIEMARKKAVREAEKRLKGELLSALLQDSLSPRDARLWVEQMGLDLEQAHVALRFSWGSAAPPSVRRLETLINGEVARLDLRVILSTMGSEVVCFCQVQPGLKKPIPAIVLGEAVLMQAAHEFPEVLLHCGIGSTASTIEDWRVTLRQSGQALEMARRLQPQPGEHKPLYYADLSVYRLLLQLEHSPELAAFQQEMLGKLLAFDGGAELIHTLEVYFEHNGNLAQTAEALYVHRNTLIYRMDRVAGITGLEMDQPEARLALQLALRIYRMLPR